MNNTVETVRGQSDSRSRCMNRLGNLTHTPMGDVVLGIRGKRGQPVYRFGQRGIPQGVDVTQQQVLGLSIVVLLVP